MLSFYLCAFFFFFLSAMKSFKAKVQVPFFLSCFSTAILTLRHTLHSVAFCLVSRHWLIV